MKPAKVREAPAQTGLSIPDVPLFAQAPHCCMCQHVIRASGTPQTRYYCNYPTMRTKKDNDKEGGSPIPEWCPLRHGHPYNP